MSDSENKSEVARLRRRIELEFQAAQWALTGLAPGTARHEFINARNESIAQYHQQLVAHVGDQAAIELACKVQVAVMGE